MPHIKLSNMLPTTDVRIKNGSSTFSLSYRRTLKLGSRNLWILITLTVFQSLILQANCQGEAKKYFSIEENLPRGHTIGTVSSNPGYTYEIATDTDHFTINQVSGEISIKKIIDREQLPNGEIKFVVKQKEQSSSATFIEVIVMITDLNDNSPHFSSRTINYTITENDVPVQPYTLTANDGDSAINGSSSLIYSIISGNEEGFWKIVTSTGSGPKTGALSLVQEVNREEIQSFQLVIEARDGGTPFKAGTVVVNIFVDDLNDNHPKFDFSLYSATVLENATIGTMVLHTRAHDADADMNSALIFSATENKLFNIDRLTGEILLQANLLNSGYATETICQSSYCNTTLCLTVCVLEIQVVDQEGRGSTLLRDQSRVKITIQDVNDHAPIISISGKQSPTVSEDAPVNSRVIAMTVTDTDKGDNGKADLTIVSGNELGHFKNPFCISYYCFVRTNALMDKEKISTYNLTFTAADRGFGSLSSSLSVIVTVLDANDHSPVFSSAQYSAVVSELDAVNSFVAAVTATDADEDENGRVTYQISDGNNDQFFKIDGDSGLVTINRRVDSDSLSIPRITLNVSASDHGSNIMRSETTLTVDIIDENDEVPTFTEVVYHRDVEENNDVNMTLLTLEAIDRDKGANGSVRYRISDTTVAEYPGMLHIGAESGVLVLVKSLDREVQDYYTIEVVAYDMGTIISRSSQVQVIINVTDVNDNRPKFYPTRYYAMVPESAGVGHLVLFVSATDADSGSNGVVSYSLSQQNAVYDRFTVDSVTGELSIASTLPGSPISYTIQIDAVDTPGGTNKATCTVEITVADSEERDPEFDSQTYSFSVLEDADGTTPDIGRLVGTVSATADTVLVYSIAAGDPDGVFTVNPSTGRLTTIERLDRDDIPAYHLTIVAQGISKVAFSYVNITLVDRNDNSPEFDKQIYRVKAAEDSPLDSVVFVAPAKDKDAGNNARITYTISPDIADRLAIDRDTGAVKLRKMIRLGETLSFTVTATDGGNEPRFDTAQVVIEASDVNDHSPVFEQREYHVAVNESAIINTRFLQLTATDADLGVNAEVTYSLVSGVNNSRPEFGVFPDGSLYVAQKLDRETKDRYQLLVQAKDRGSPIQRTDSALVHIKVLDDNDNYPEFSSQSYEFRVVEGKDVGAYIGSVSARDADTGRNSDLMYFFTTNQHNFALDPFTGEIRSIIEFDREKISRYSLTARAIDNGITRRYAETSLVVIVEDVNDNSPTFSKAVYDVKISEGVQPGLMINPLSAGDPDLDINGIVEYSIISGNEKGHFRMDQNTGTISVEAALDRESQSDYELLVKATDNGKPPLSSNATVHIQLTDANNRSPEFDRQSYSVDINEDADIGTVVGKVAATDADLGVNAIIEYSIVQGNAEGTFGIVRETGQIRLARSLDYEYKQLYTLTIHASNRPPESLSAQTRLSINIVDVNDNRPRFVNDIVSVYLSENSSISTQVVTVSANDSDSGMNGKVSYKILSQPSPKKFVINKDGVISTKALIDRENPNNYEVVEEYTIVVEATDQAVAISKRLSTKRTIIVSITDVNDNTPHFVSPSAGVVLENSASGTEVMTVHARDKDTDRNAQITYSLRSGTSYFSIDTVSGLITLKRSVSTSPVIHSITVRAADNGQPQRSTEQSIKVLISSSIDSGLTFAQNSYTQDILETFLSDRNIIQVEASQSNVEYYITRVTSLGKTQPALFSISLETGQIQRAMSLDRDQGFVKYTIEVYARDKNSGVPRTAKTDVVITLLDVNDSVPKFSSLSYITDCPEDAVIGRVVANVTATDADEDTTLTYSISSSSGAFVIDGRGQVKVAGPLDRESTPVYTLLVSATDPTYTSTVELTISLLDVNDEPPKFSKDQYSLSISEKATPGDAVGSVKAVDNDLGVGGEATYKIVTTWGSDLFRIDPQSGLITLDGTLNFEEVQLYILHVEASDKDPVNPLTSNTTLYINVIDENDNAPVFSPASYTASVSEHVQPGVPIVNVTAFDDDAGMNGRVHYSILTSEVPFVVDGDSGTISTSRELDREDVDKYIVVVQAEDFATGNALSSTARVTISIEDSNDNKPSFALPHTFYVNESSSPGSIVATVVADDLDIGINKQITYTLLTDTSVFELNPTNGKLKLLGSLDREDTASFQLSVKATDGGSPSLSSTISYTIIVEDTNDNAPQFRPDQMTKLDVREDQVAGEVLLNISANDADTGLASEIRYYIIGGDPNEDFHLDQFTGKLSVSRGLDYERTKFYTLAVQAEDLGPESKSSLIDIQVTVLDWNDSPPVFLHSPYYVYLQEGATSLPVQLLTVEAFDADSALYNQSTYELMFGLDDDSQLSRNTFTIDSVSGELSATRAVDREQTSSFTLKVIAKNSVAGSAELSGEATVYVIVKDINDHAPIFDLPIYSTNVREGRSPEQQIIQVTASDLDIGSNAEVRYALFNDSAADSFAIDYLTGWIRNKVVLDREVSDKYDLSVIAYDLGDVSQSSSANVKIQIMDINDNSPAFTQDQLNVQLKDPTSDGDFVIGSTAVDPDKGSNGSILYSLHGVNAAKFSLDPNTGVIMAAQRLSGPADLELTIRATDGGNRFSELSVNISFRAYSNSAKPTFQDSISLIPLSESHLVGSDIATVTAMPSDSSRSILYSIVGGNIGNTFDIKPDGRVVLDRKLDYSMASRYRLWIQAKDSTSDITAFKRLIIQVQDENDHIPEFEKALYVTSVVEQQNIFGSHLLVKVKATDLDSGLAGNITYSLISGNIDNPFYLDTDGSLRLTKPLDRETIPRYHLVIQATDGGGLNSTTIVIINVEDINDMFPRFESSYNWDVAEDVLVGSVVSSVHARDGDIGANADIAYSLASPSSHFDVTSSGNITVKAKLDREMKSSYDVVVSARNTGPENVISGTTTVQITVTDVNDNAPEFLPSPQYHFTFAEKQAAGSIVAKIDTTDKDSAGPNSLIRYQLVSPSSFFIIDPETGSIRSKDVLEFDVTGIHNSYVLYVEAQDSGVPSHTSVASVNISIMDANDHAPQFTQNSYFSAVPDEIDVGTETLAVTAVDLLDYEVNAEVSYSIAGGNGSSLFKINSTNGRITVKTSLVGNTDQYRTLQVKAEDHGVPAQSSQVTVTMLITPENRYPPRWITSNPITFDVSEEEDPGYEIAIVEAGDTDSGINAQILYSINLGNEIDDSLFNIDPDTGRITLSKRLDYEKSKKHQVTLQAQDKAFYSRRIYTVLTLTVLDADDSPPVFSRSAYTAEVSENMPSDTLVTKLTATDADQGANAEIRYSIIGDSTSSSYFTIRPFTGEIISRATFDYELRDHYNLIVKATNPNSDKFESTVYVTVNIKGMNEFPPSFIQNSYTFDVSESVKVGYVLGTLMATDQDAGIDGKLEFMLVTESNNKGFSLGRKSGKLMVAETLDRESVASIQLTALVKNPGPVQGNDTDTVTIWVNLDDANDSPKFEHSSYNGSVRENTDSGAHIVTVKATDSDQLASNQVFSYALQDDYGSFSINSKSGKIVATRTLDREEQARYALVVQAIDEGQPPLTGQAIVYVQVADVNDESPYFDPPIPQGEVTEGTQADVSVLVLSAFTRDDDAAPNREPFTYDLNSEQFYVDENTGTVFSKNVVIDYETTKFYMLSVEVKDSGRRTSQLQARVNVKDRNDEPSRSRDLAIMVQSYNPFVSGVIGTVEPLDTDLVGDYTCNMTSSSSLSLIGSSCQLLAKNLTSDASLEVTGNDGIHGTVQSSVNVRVKTYTNQTLNAAIVMRVSGITLTDFVSNSQSFLKSINKFASDGQSARLLSLRGTGEYIDLYLVLEKADGTHSSSIASIISTNKNAIERENGLVITTHRRNVCNSASCSGNGECRSQVVVHSQMDYTSTPSLTLAYDVASLQPMCTCVQEYIGATCSEEAGACINMPCMNGASCQPVGETGYECMCTPYWQGSQCQLDVDECEQDDKCLNGGRCTNEEGSFKCKCTEHYQGVRCEAEIKCADRNPCHESSTCIDLPEGGYECRCAYGFYGELCEQSSFGFEEGSFLELSPLDASTNDIKMTLATKNMNALILFQSGANSQFIALQIMNGSVAFTFNLAGQGRGGVTVSKQVSSGRWVRIHAKRTPTEATLEIVFCKSPTDCPTRCNEQVDCYSSINLSPSQGQLNTWSNRVHIGGTSDIDVILPFSSVLSSGNFVGCIGNLQIDGKVITVDQSQGPSSVKDTCPRLQAEQSKAECNRLCGAGNECHVDWFSALCPCEKFYSHLSCSEALIDINVSVGLHSAIHYKYIESYRRSQLLKLSSAKRRKRQLTSASSRFSLSFRTGGDGVLMSTVPASADRSLQVVDGYAVYGKLKHSLEGLTDGDWHDIALVVTETSIILTVDGTQVVDDSSTPEDFLDPSVVSELVVADKYEGCIADILLNGHKLPMSAAVTDKFDVSVSGTESITAGCDACPTAVDVCGKGKMCDEATAACIKVKEDEKLLKPWMYALIIVLSVVLVLGLVLVTVYICRRRKTNMKGSSAMKSSTMPIITSQLSKSGDTNGHDNLTDNDILASEHQNTRSYNNMSPSLPGLQQTSRTVPSPYQQLEDSTVIIEGSVTGGLNSSEKYNCDQFYDFDGADSIAPSDVDIRKYYKGYRKGDNMEMQMIPKHMRQQPRISPSRHSPKPNIISRESPPPRQFAVSPATRQSPLVVNGGYDANRQETPINQLQQRCLRQTPIDELNKRIALEQRTEAPRRDSESSLTDGSTIRQPHWTHAKTSQAPSSRPNSRPNSRSASRQQMPIINHISAQRQQDLNRLSHRSASSSIDNSDDDIARRQPMERNIYSEAGDSSSDESSNDSFTASEFEADEPKVRNDYQPTNMMFTKLQEVEDESDTGDPNAYRTTFSWDGLRNVDTSLQRFINHSDSNTDLDSVTKSKKPPAFRWDHFLSWGPGFEKLVGVFSDLAELPQNQIDEIDIQSSRDSEEYV